MGLGPGLFQESLEGSLRPMVAKVRQTTNQTNLIIYVIIKSYGKVGPALRDVASSHQEEVAAAGEVNFCFYMHICDISYILVDNIYDMF